MNPDKIVDFFTAEKETVVQILDDDNETYVSYVNDELDDEDEEEENEE